MSIRILDSSMNEGWLVFKPLGSGVSKSKVFAGESKMITVDFNKVGGELIKEYEGYPSALPANVLMGRSMQD